MKRLFILLAIVVQCSMFNVERSMAYNKVRLVITDGITDLQLKQQMQKAETTAPADSSAQLRTLFFSNKMPPH